MACGSPGGHLGAMGEELGAMNRAQFLTHRAQFLPIVPNSSPSRPTPCPAISAPFSTDFAWIPPRYTTHPCHYRSPIIFILCHITPHAIHDQPHVRPALPITSPHRAQFRVRRSPCSLPSTSSTLYNGGATGNHHRRGCVDHDATPTPTGSLHGPAFLVAGG